MQTHAREHHREHTHTHTHKMRKMIFRLTCNGTLWCVHCISRTPGHRSAHAASMHSLFAQLPAPPHPAHPPTPLSPCKLPAFFHTPPCSPPPPNSPSSERNTSNPQRLAGHSANKCHELSPDGIGPEICLQTNTLRPEACPRTATCSIQYRCGAGMDKRAWGPVLMVEGTGMGRRTRSPCVQTAEA